MGMFCVYSCMALEFLPHPPGVDPWALSTLLLSLSTLLLFINCACVTMLTHSVACGSQRLKLSIFLSDSPP